MCNGLCVPEFIMETLFYDKWLFLPTPPRRGDYETSPHSLIYHLKAGTLQANMMWRRWRLGDSPILAFIALRGTNHELWQQNPLLPAHLLPPPFPLHDLHAAWWLVVDRFLLNTDSQDEAGSSLAPLSLVVRHLRWDCSPCNSQLRTLQLPSLEEGTVILSVLQYSICHFLQPIDMYVECWSFMDASCVFSLPIMLLPKADLDIFARWTINHRLTENALRHSLT